MRYSIVCAVALILAMATAARADFVLKNTTPPQSTPSPPVAPTPDGGQPATADQGTTPQAPDQTPAPAPKVHWKMAYGFGDAVPLGFACRQIIPSAVRVTYGPGASPAMRVDWKGGDTWNHVLYHAVQPLGLHLVMTHMAVEIIK